MENEEDKAEREKRGKEALHHLEQALDEALRQEMVSAETTEPAVAAVSARAMGSVGPVAIGNRWAQVTMKLMALGTLRVSSFRFLIQICRNQLVCGQMLCAFEFVFDVGLGGKRVSELQLESCNPEDWCDHSQPMGGPGAKTGVFEATVA